MFNFTNNRKDDIIEIASSPSDSRSTAVGKTI